MQLISTLLITLAQAYSICSKTEYQYKGQNVSSPVQYSATRQFNLKGQTINVQISGTFEVVDGCAFKVTNLVLGGGNYTVGIYGGIIGSTATAVRLTEATLDSGAGPINRQFDFISAAGSAVSYSDFNQFRVFVPEAQALIGTADLPGKVTTGSPTPTPSTGTAPQPTTGTGPAASDPTPTSGGYIQYYSAPLALVLGFVLTCL